MFQFQDFMKQKKLFVLAGEVSGDLHASGVLDALRNQYPDLDVFGTGGVKLRSLGARLLYDTDDLSVMGFVEVLRQAFFLRKVIGDLKDSVLREKPDVALLVDYPAMNLHMARFLKRNGIPVVYYISPKVWAWKEGRVMKMKRSIDRLLVIFNFEVEFFARHGMVAEYAGNPVVEELLHLDMQPRKQFLRRHAINDGTVLIGLLPGSRKQEISLIYPEMLEAARMLGERYDAVFLVGKASHVNHALFEAYERIPGVRLIECSAYEVMQYADAALVTSGTATLEALCFGLPMVVVYRTGWLNYVIGKRIVKLHNISLANIITKGLLSDEQTVPELIQHEASGERMCREVSFLIDNPLRREEMRAALLDARAQLASSSPSLKAASVISHYFELEQTHGTDRQLSC